MCVNSLVSEIPDAQKRVRLARIAVQYQAEIRLCIQPSHYPNLCLNHWFIGVSFPLTVSFMSDQREVLLKIDLFP